MKEAQPHDRGPARQTREGSRGLSINAAHPRRPLSTWTARPPANRAVIDAMDDYYRRYNANPLAASTPISEERPPLRVGAAPVATFINAASPKE